MPDPRLGRIYRPDDRDWTTAKLHAAVEPPDSLLNEKVGDAINDSPFFQTWKGWLALWKWVKAHAAKPIPTPIGHPGWVPGPVLDQGAYGTCVGNGWAGWGDATPIADQYTEIDARAIYYESTIIGGSPDNPDAIGGGQQGSTVRDGAKAMQKRGTLLAYAFATSLADVDEWLDNHGPVVFGTDWTSDMFNPSPSGLIVSSGPVEGGHCYLCYDRLDDEDAYLFRNSWGAGWGMNGDFKMRSADVQNLLTGIESPGEACLAAEVVH